MTSDVGRADRMRILQIVAAPASGGAETFVRDLSCALAAKGQTVYVAFIDHAVDLDRDPGFEEAFLAQLDEHGVGYSFLGHDTRRKPWLGLLKLRQLVREQDIQLIHSHLAYGNVFAAGVPHVPLIYTHHSENARFSKVFWSYFRSRVAHFIGISESCTNNLRIYAGQRAKISMIINGIDLTGIPARPVARERAVLRAICVGRITAQKNYPLLARAIAALDTGYRRRLTVDIYGEGEATIMESCADILRDANAPVEMLRFRGVSSKLREILQDYDMFLMSSKWEGMPIALIEAAAAGLPIVATDVGGCREITGSGAAAEASGVIVPPDDVLAFSSAIATMLDDAEMRMCWSQNALDAAQAFSISQSADDHALLYQGVML